jgi:hypothetical protein
MSEEELNQRAADLAKREAALTQRIVRVELAAALADAKCRPEALQDAAALMAAGAEIELAEDGLSVAKVTIGGEAHGAAAAARAFLKARPFFQAPEEDASTKVTPAATTARPDTLVSTAFATPAPKPAPKPAAKPESASPFDLCQQGWSEPPE